MDKVHTKIYLSNTVLWRHQKNMLRFARTLTDPVRFLRSSKSYICLSTFFVSIYTIIYEYLSKANIVDLAKEYTCRVELAG